MWPIEILTFSYLKSLIKNRRLRSLLDIHAKVAPTGCQFHRQGPEFAQTIESLRAGKKTLSYLEKIYWKDFLLQENRHDFTQEKRFSTGF